MKKSIFSVLLATVLSSHALDIAQFHSLIGPGTPFPFNGSPAQVSFIGGTLLNPTGTNFFTVAVTNSASTSSPGGTPGFAFTGMVPGSPTGITVANAALTPAIVAALDTTDDLDIFAFKGGVGAVITITLDFTNLPGGFLPAGSILAYADVDFLETAVLTGASGWFNLGTISLLDVTNGVILETSQSDTTPADFTSFAGSATTLTLTGAVAATDSPGVIIPLAINLTSLTITAAGPGNSANFFQAFGIAAIPEPTSVAMLILGGMFLLRRRTSRLAGN